MVVFKLISVMRFSELFFNIEKDALLKQIIRLEKRVELKVHTFDACFDLHHLLQLLYGFVKFKEVASFSELAIHHES